jgi:prohibitin 1
MMIIIFMTITSTTKGNEVLKSVVAHYNAEELLSKREQVSLAIRLALVERAAKFNLILDDVSITHLTFGKEFAKAIEHKQVAQQEAETQTYVVAKADQERKAAIIRAEGMLYVIYSLHCCCGGGGGGGGGWLMILILVK